MKNKEKYRELCRTEPSIPIFSKDWWLDTVAGEANWNVALVERGGTIIASMPYVIKKKWIIRYISMPPLTQTAGIWLKYPDGQKYPNRISFEREVYREIIDQLPEVAAFEQNFHYTFTNWLPFYWKGFRQTTRYTYVLEEIEDQEKLFSGLKENIRREIRKAEKRVSVIIGGDIENFYKVYQKTYARQNRKPPYDLEILKRIDAACKEEKCRKIFMSLDENQAVHAAIYLIWDSESAYYLMGGGDPKLRNSGATSLLMWEAIKFAATVTKKFDFEGSMVQPIEQFFSAFGAIQKPYYTISKTDSFLLKIRNGLKEVMK